MGMEMKNNSTSNTQFHVIHSDNTNYSISSTLTGLKLSMEFMGQQSSYNSDLKEDSASEIGKSIKNLNVPDTLSINKYTAMVISDKKPVTVSMEENTNPFESLFGSLGEKNADTDITDAFFIIPPEKKIGDSWIDSSSTKEQRTVKTYTLRSIDKDIASISLIGKVDSNIQYEMQSLPVNISMTTQTIGEIFSNTKTSLVGKRTIKADITGNIELMGQSAPITGKANTVSVYEY